MGRWTSVGLTTEFPVSIAVPTVADPTAVHMADGQGFVCDVPAGSARNVFAAQSYPLLGADYH